jgi:hypothetical protein
MLVTGQLSRRQMAPSRLDHICRPSNKPGTVHAMALIGSVPCALVWVYLMLVCTGEAANSCWPAMAHSMLDLELAWCVAIAF